VGGEKYYKMSLPLFVTIVSAVAVVITLMLTQAATQSPVLCMSSETREKSRELMLAGIDRALESHTVHMFDGWMKDPSAQPKRANTGMHNAVSAYIGVRDNIARWNPPLCTGPNP